MTATDITVNYNNSLTVKYVFYIHGAHQEKYYFVNKHKMCYACDWNGCIIQTVHT